MYRVKVKDTVSGRIYELPFMSLVYTEEINKDKDARITLDWQGVNQVASASGLTPYDILGAGLREVWIEKDGTKVYVGVISDLETREDEKGNAQINVASVGYFVLLGKRIVGVPKRVFSSTDAGMIAWTIINESQQSDPPYSDLGITQGLIQSSKNRDRTFRFERIKDAIEKMSNLYLKDGFDFEIDNEKKFNVYYPQKGSKNQSVVFDERNIIKWSVRRPLVLSLTNKVYVLGDGFNDDVLYVTREAAATYKNSFGLLEDKLMARDVKTTDTLNDKGDRYLLDNQSPIDEITIYTRLDEGYGLGDSVKVFLPKVGISGYYKRIIKKSVSVDVNGFNLVQLLLK